MMRRYFWLLLATVFALGTTSADAQTARQKLLLSTHGSSAPSLDLSFLTGSLPSGVTLTRSSSATYFDSAGVLQTALSDVPRFDYSPSALTLNGLLVEPARTNLALQSNTFNTTWTTTATNAAITAASGTSPDGTNNAWKLKEATTSGSQHALLQSVTKAASSLPYTFTIIAKPVERTRVLQTLDDGTGSNGGRVTIDLSGVQAGVAAATFGSGWSSISVIIQNIGNGWVKSSLTVTSGTVTTIRMLTVLDSGSGTGAGSTSYAGVVGNGVLVYGSQLEQASSPTSYIATTTAAVARAVDIVTVPTTAFAWNPLAGSFAVEIMPQTLTSGASFIGGGAGSSNNPDFIGSHGGPVEFSDGTNQLFTSNSFSINAILRAASSWNGVGKAVVLNGGTVNSTATINSSNWSAMTALGLGSNAGSNAVLGSLRRVRYFNQRVPEAQLKALTLP